jgi:hypothetical protein
VIGQYGDIYDNAGPYSTVVFARVEEPLWQINHELVRDIIDPAKSPGHVGSLCS